MLKSVKVCGVGLMLTVFLSSCTHTVNGSTNYFPDGTDATSYSTKLIVDVHGAPARAYIHKTRKKVLVTLRDRQGRLLDQGKYILEAGDVRWSSREIGGAKFELVFYDFEPIETNGRGGEQTRQVLTLTYDGDVLKESRGNQVPDWVLSHIASKLTRDDRRQIHRMSLPFTEATLGNLLDLLRANSSELQLNEDSIRKWDRAELARFSASNLVLTFRRNNTSGMLEALVEDWGRHELTKSIRDKIVDHESCHVTRSRAIVRLASEFQMDGILPTANDVARNCGLSESENFPEAYLAGYEAPGMVALVCHLNSPDRVIVNIEETDPGREVSQFEAQLRVRLDEFLK